MRVFISQSILFAKKVNKLVYSISRVQVIVAHTTQNIIFKNHLIDILHDENSLYNIMVRIYNKKTLSGSWILNFYKLPKLKTFSDDSCKAKTAQDRHFMTQE